MRLKHVILLLILIIGSLFISIPSAQVYSPVTWERTTGASILIYVGDSYYSNSADKFIEAYSSTSNTVEIVSSYDFTTAILDQYDAILMSNFESSLTLANQTALRTFVESGNKLLWMAANDDYGEFYKSNETVNQVLETVKSNLRIDGGAISDPESNDGAAYRVVANETGVSSIATDYVTTNYNESIFHGTSSVSFYNYTTATYEDLRHQQLAKSNIDIYVNSSSAAIATDAGSISDYDVYAYTAETGNYPMLASQQINGSVIIASGEAIFTDYKEMYGWFYEISLEPHDGIMLVDKLLSYWLTDEGMNFAGTSTVTVVRPIIEYVTETESIPTGEVTVTETNERTAYNDRTVTTTVTTTINDIGDTQINPTPISIIPVFLVFIMFGIITRHRRRID